MRFRVTHSTRYDYSRPVFLEPMTIRLRPRCDAWQHLHRFTLEISPEPSGVAEWTDLDGNTVAQAWFDGTTERLTVRTQTDVSTLRTNPFDHLLVDGRPPRASAYLRHSRDRAIATFAERVRRRSDTHASYLARLTSAVHERCETETRPEGHAWPAPRTFEARRGSCRDVAVLLADACRWQGYPARFVSGYVEPDADTDLHAWTEVYVPSGGWRGFDPSSGLAVSDRHVALAAAARAADAAPVGGSFRGDATARMSVGLRVRCSLR